MWQLGKKHYSNKCIAWYIEECWMRRDKRSVPVWAKRSLKSHVRLSNACVEDNEHVHTCVYKHLIYK